MSPHKKGKRMEQEDNNLFPDLDWSIPDIGDGLEKLNWNVESIDIEKMQEIFKMQVEEILNRDFTKEIAQAQKAITETRKWVEDIKRQNNERKK